MLGYEIIQTNLSYSFFSLFLQDGADSYGIEWTGPLPVAADEGAITVPPVCVPLPESVYSELKNTINPLGSSINRGMDLYRSTLEFVYSHGLCV